jgi:hypothetical protein
VIGRTRARRAAGRPAPVVRPNGSRRRPPSTLGQTRPRPGLRARGPSVVPRRVRGPLPRQGRLRHRYATPDPWALRLLRPEARTGRGPARRARDTTEGGATAMIRRSARKRADLTRERAEASIKAQPETESRSITPGRDPKPHPGGAGAGRWWAALMIVDPVRPWSDMTAAPMRFMYRIR